MVKFDARGNAVVSNISCGENSIKLKVEFPAVYTHVESENKQVGTICLVGFKGKLQAGISICCAEDVFDEAKGKAIAYDRAIKEQYVELPRRYRKLFEKSYRKLEKVATATFFNNVPKAPPVVTKYPYVGIYNCVEGLHLFKGLTVLFTGVEEGYIVHGVKNNIIGGYSADGVKRSLKENLFKKMFEV